MLRIVSADYIASLVSEVERLRAREASLLDALLEAKNVPLRFAPQEHETGPTGKRRISWDQRKAELEAEALRLANVNTDTN